MHTIKITIEYDGTDFNGWQLQTKKGSRTVQGEIEKALAIILKKKTRIYGSGRTDSGAHALGQVAHFKSNSTLPPETLIKAINGNLPPDIAITALEPVMPDFHAQLSAKRKTYRYTILNRVEPSALNRRFCLHIPYKLNVSLMRQEAKALVGKHDFRSFMAMDRSPRSKARQKDSIREVYRADIQKKGPYILFEIEANGFLYKMVRNIAGTLVELGRGRMKKGSMRKILNAKDRATAGSTAAAHGLCLINVSYTKQ